LHDNELIMNGLLVCLIMVGNFDEAMNFCRTSNRTPKHVLDIGDDASFGADRFILCQCHYRSSLPPS